MDVIKKLSRMSPFEGRAENDLEFNDFEIRRLRKFSHVRINASMELAGSDKWLELVAITLQEMGEEQGRKFLYNLSLRVQWLKSLNHRFGDGSISNEELVEYMIRSYPEETVHGIMAMTMADEVLQHHFPFSGIFLLTEEEQDLTLEVNSGYSQNERAYQVDKREDRENVANARFVYLRDRIRDGEVADQLFEQYLRRYYAQTAAILGLEVPGFLMSMVPGEREIYDSHLKNDGDDALLLEFIQGISKSMDEESPDCEPVFKQRRAATTMQQVDQVLQGLGEYSDLKAFLNDPTNITRAVQEFLHGC